MFTELIDRLGLMLKVCDCLGMNAEALPDPTTFATTVGHGAFLGALEATAQVGD